jgi:putative peptidoglycan lipid II flippase
MTASTTMIAGTAVRRVATDSFIGSAGTMVSRATGLVRLVVVAGVLGPTQFANLYQAANSLPNLAFELLTGSMVASLLVPVLVRHLDRGDRVASARVANVFLTVSVVAGLVFVALAVASGRLVLDVLTAGVPAGAVRTEAPQAWLLLGLLLLQIPLYLGIATATSVQNARGRFALPAGAPCVENLGIIAVLGVYAFLFGTGAPVGPGFTGVVLLGVGTTGAVALHAAVQWWGARRCGVRLTLTRKGWRDAEVWAIARLAVPSAATTSLEVARSLCALIIAAAIPGGVVALTIAWAFYNVPAALAAKPVSQAALPPLSRAYHRHDDASYAETFDRSLGLTLFLTVPAAVAFAVLSGPLTIAVTFGEMATAQGRELVYYALLGISLGVVGDAVVHFITQAAYARRNAAQPFRACVVRTVLTIAGMGMSLALLDGPGLLLGIGLSISVSDLVGGMVLYWTVRRRLSGLQPSLAGPATGTVAAALLMVPIMMLTLTVLDPRPAPLHGVLTSLLAGAAGAVTYVGAQWALGSPEITELLPAVRKARRTRARVTAGRPTAPAPAPRAAPDLMTVPFVVITVLLTLAVAVAPTVGVGLAMAGLVLLLTVLRPVWAVVGYIVLDPLLAGFERGSMVPGLRLNEVLLIPVLAGLLPVLLRRRLESDRRPNLSVKPLDAAVFALAFTGSVSTLMWMYARARDITTDDLLYALTLWRLVAVYVMVRVVLRQARAVRAALMAVLAVAGLIGVVGLLQALGVRAVIDGLSTLFPPQPGGYGLSDNRATATLGNPIAYGDVMLYAAVIAAALARALRRTRWYLALAGALALSALASGQVSILIAVVITGLALAMVTRTIGRATLSLAALLAVALLVLRPVLAARLNSASADPVTGLPDSWTGPYGRLTNLEQYFWPKIAVDYNWLFGVRTAGRVPGLESWRSWVYIESGYTWAVWTGGLPLLAAVIVLLVVTVRTGRRLTPSEEPVARAIGITVTTLAYSLAVLMIFDPHLTFRGAGEMVFILLALAANLDRSAPMTDPEQVQVGIDGVPTVGEEADDRAARPVPA